MSFAPPANEGLLSQMTGVEQSSYLRWRRAAEVAAAENPQLDHSVYTRYLHSHLNAAIEHRQKLNEIGETFAQTGTAMPVTTRVHKSMDLEHNFMQGFSQSVTPAEKPAWEAMVRKYKGSGIVGGIVKNVYDSDRGGLQFAGIAGAIAGFIAGRKYFGSSSIKDRILTVIAAIGGAWMLNTIAKALGSLRPREPETPIVKPVATPATAAAITTDPAQAADQSRLDRLMGLPASTGVMTDVDAAQSGGFATPPVPNANTPPPATRNPQINNANTAR